MFDGTQARTRPRDPAAPQLNLLKRALGQLAMEEQQRHQADELGRADA